MNRFKEAMKCLVSWKKQKDILEFGNNKEIFLKSHENNISNISKGYEESLLMIEQDRYSNGLSNSKQRINLIVPIEEYKIKPYYNPQEYIEQKKMQKDVKCIYVRSLGNDLKRIKRMAAHELAEKLIEMNILHLEPNCGEGHMFYINYFE